MLFRSEEIVALAKQLGWNVEHAQTNRMLVLFARALVQRKPLTDEQIMEILDYGRYGSVPAYQRNFVRAIEQAHGIGEQA